MLFFFLAFVYEAMRLRQGFKLHGFLSRKSNKNAKKHIFVLSVSAVCRLNGLLGYIKVSKSILMFQLLTFKDKGYMPNFVSVTLLEYASCKNRRLYYLDMMCLF